MSEDFDDFYLRFENRFRGSTAEIKQRLEVYIDLVALIPHNGSKTALDIGCGRGEWMEVLRDAGWAPYGLDLNSRVIAQSRALGFDVRAEDALEHLRRLPDNSLPLITGFHIVEHLEFPYLRAFIAETRRVLMPGGLGIFETPNPENFKVGSHTFYLDPTHIRPVPPLLLDFIVKDAGFSQTDIVRLNADAELTLSGKSGISEGEKHLLHMAYGPRDYASIAFKGGEGHDALWARMAAVVAAINKENLSPRPAVA